jgi:hypothetical protein
LIDPDSGKVQHVVIGLGRQPEPPVERFTRVTEKVKRLVEL